VPGITNLMEREGRSYFLISGHRKSDRVKQAFTKILKAVSAFKRVWGSRLGMIGHLYPGMIDFGYDPTTMFATFGATTVPVLESSVLETYKRIEDREVRKLAAELESKYAKAPDFVHEEFIRSVRTAIALKALAHEHELDAITVYCQSLWQRPEMGVVPCIGMSLLMQEGTFCSCEGDVPTSLAGMILEEISGASFFTEIWCNDFENNQFMMGHSGTMNLRLFEGNNEAVNMVRHPWWTGCGGRGACLEVKMPPGEATMLSICPVQGKQWRMIVSKAEIVQREPVPLGAPNFFARFEKSITRYLEELAGLGAAHHFSMAYGDWTEHLRACAKVFKVDYSAL